MRFGTSLLIYLLHICAVYTCVCTHLRTLIAEVGKILPIFLARTSSLKREQEIVKLSKVSI